MAAPVEFTIGPNRYRAARLDAFRQLRVARRLGPAVMRAARNVLIDGVDIKGLVKDAKDDEEGAWRAAGALIDALGEMTDEDVESVLTTCLDSVTRAALDSNGNVTGWAPIRSAGHMMFEDIDNMMSVGQILWQVLLANGLAAFFSEGPSLLSTAGTTGRP